MSNKVARMNQDQVIQDMLQQKREKKKAKYCYTYEQIEAMKRAAYAKGFNDGFNDGTDRDTETAQIIFSINTAMYLRDNFRCGGKGLENYFSYMKHMDELREKGLYDLQGQIDQLKEETGIQIIAEDNKKASLVVEFLDVGEKEFYKRHPEIKLKALLNY